MINQDRVREMNKMAILESGVGEKELKISTYRRADFVILQLVKGFVAGTVCFAAIVMLWLCSKWDDLNQYFANVDYMQLLKQTAIFYIIFMAGYLVCMVQLLKIKEHIYRFIGKYEIYTIAVFRFLVAFAAFTLINQKIGYMDLLKEYPIPLLFALLCSFLPSGMMLFLGAVLILLNCYALSLELCGIVALIFVILFCIYFRFSRKKGMYAVLTPVLGVAGIPYVVPVASGLLSRVYAVVSVVCGEMVFFLLKNINENAALFSAKDGITKKSVVTLAVTEIFTDKEMYIFLGGFAAAAIVVSCIRKLTVDHGRTIAAVIGIAVEMGIICSGEIYIGESGRIVKVIAGCIISLLIVLVLDFMTLSVDYSRVEHTQFEDDEYYYYVKAVPKAFVPVEDKQVKKINANRAKNRKITRGKKVNSVHVGHPDDSEKDDLETQIMNELHDDK